MPTDDLGAVRTDGGPVVHLRRPQDRVTIVLEPEPPEQWPGVLLPPFRLALTGPVGVYDAPGGRLVQTANDNRTLDVYEIATRGAARWWRVTNRANTGNLWVAGAALVK